ncbi:hypothetical protein DIZ81_01575 [Legionella taurinensis]|uniref:Uncharacterized protein n=1 Tax=Legionella taurinensis TaxID=70611 RepID=A0AB38N7V8_9GAMM|nr:hypothetical protein [Legionella taurinensis]MDX1836434.1 hypothetical protein [Legionella taurinensis]PUT43094.1 hypothetical protein DB744_01580 [Legionella taurinensis]PUT45089.1 hypothetical protein DB743_06975 [Legionella taurinensis]PUT45649.1 hypothetical protein DB746_01580 [Legionella taurinensis]PUT49418.1 hypothetical protein DB745_01580 [Legionella taurinensis]
MAKNFSDNMLSQMYLGLAADYKKLFEQSPALAPEQIYWTLYFKVYGELANDGSAFYGLDVEGQGKAWAVFNAFIASTPLYSNNFAQLQQFQREENIKNKLKKRQQLIFINTDPYCRHDALFDWAMLNLYFSSLHAHHHHGGWWGSHHHGHGSNDSINGEGLAFLILLVLVLIAAVLACIALYYMLSQTLNSLERFVWNEGWLQAFITLSSMAAFTTAGALLGTMVVASPLSALVLAAGISNPVGLVVFTTVCLSLALGALGCFATNKLQKYLLKNNDAIDPMDACRFQLTDSEMNDLLDAGLDPIAVKCAITALRGRMGEEGVPALLTRWFTTRGGEKQAILAQVRQLRRGELEEIKVDDMTFNLRRPQVFIPAYYYNAQTQDYVYQTGNLYPQLNVVPPSQPDAYVQHHHGHPSNMASYSDSPPPYEPTQSVYAPSAPNFG